MSEKAPSSSESSTPLLSADKLVSATDSQIAELQAQYDAWQREGTGGTNRRVLLDVADMADRARNPDKKTTSPFDTPSEAKGIYVDTREKSLEAVQERQHRLAEAGEASRRIGDKLSSTAVHEHDETVVGGEVVDIDIATTTVDDELTFQTVEAPDGTAQIIEIAADGDDEPSHEIIISERGDQTIDMTFDGHPADEDEIVSVEAVLEHIESITAGKTDDVIESESAVEDEEESQQVEVVEDREATAVSEAEEIRVDDKTETTEPDEGVVEEVVRDEPEQAVETSQQEVPRVEQQDKARADKEAAMKVQVAGALRQTFSGQTGAVAQGIVQKIAAEQKSNPADLLKRFQEGSISVDPDLIRNLQQVMANRTSSIWRENPNAPSMIGRAAREAHEQLEKVLRSALA